MEGEMVEEMVVKLVEKMEMVGGGDGRPKGSLVGCVCCWRLAGNGRRKKRDERERKKWGWLYKGGKN